MANGNVPELWRFTFHITTNCQNRNSVPFAPRKLFQELRNFSLSSPSNQDPKLQTDKEVTLRDFESSSQNENELFIMKSRDVFYEKLV